MGYGVSACATCDGAFFKEKHVAIVGGGDTAMEEAIFLTRFASKVTVIHRRETLRASKVMADRAMKNPKIEFLWNHTVVEALGTKPERLGAPGGLTGLRIQNTQSGEEREFPCDGFFVAIGHKPNTELFVDQLELHDTGYIKVVPGTSKTSIDGVFACGDVQDSVYRQAVTAAGHRMHGRDRCRTVARGPRRLTGAVVPFSRSRMDMLFSRTPRSWALLCAAAFALEATGCSDEVPQITVTPTVTDAGCNLGLAPRFYEVFFVLDVSTSMTRFLELGLAQQLDSLTRALPERDSIDQRVFVDYYVLGFANDFKWFPEGAARRMTSRIAVQSAIEQAVNAGRDGNNLTQPFANTEAPENLLDALSAVIDFNPQAEVVVVIVATDANISEFPTVLSTEIPVQSSYANVLQDLLDRDIQLHALTIAELDGLTRMFKGQPPLTSGPGSRTYRLSELVASQEALQGALQEIGQTAACN